MEKKFTFRQVCIIVAVAVILSVFATSAAIYIVYSAQTRYIVSFDANEVKLENVKKFSQVWDLIRNDYYQEVDENVLLEGAVNGIAESLKDPYTVYFNKDQMKAFMEKTEEAMLELG